jgi:putative phage-type endonuclease
MNAPAEATDRTHEVTAFHKHALWTGVTDANRSAWLRERSKIITASRVPALLGLSPREDAFDVYVDALRPANDFHDVDFGLNDPRTWGSALEEAIARQAGKHYGWGVRMSGALLVSRSHPYLGCTQDAEVEEVAGSGQWVSYEGKTTSNFLAKTWDEDFERAPDHVIAQVQTQLLVTGASKSIVSCLIGGQKFVRVDMFPDPEFFDLILTVVDDMRDRVSRMDPPPPTWRSKEAIKRLYPEDDGEVVVLPKDALEWTRELQEIMPRKQELERREEELKNLLRASIGNATIGVLSDEIGGKTQWTNATTHRAGYTVNPTSFRVLRSSSGSKKRKSRAA